MFCQIPHFSISCLDQATRMRCTQQTLGEQSAWSCVLCFPSPPPLPTALWQDQHQDTFDCGLQIYLENMWHVTTSLVSFFAMAKIRRIGHGHQAPFFLLLFLLFLDFNCETRRKQAATCTIHLGPPIFIQILDSLWNDHERAKLKVPPTPLHRCPCKDILTFLLRHQLGLY